MSKLIFTSLVFVTIAFSCHSTSGNEVDPNSHSIQDARNAYFQMDHKTAYQIFGNVWEDESQSLEDRVNAGLSVARMDWLFYRKASSALEKIEEVLQSKHRQSAVYNLKARILAAELRFDQAMNAAEQALRSAESETEKYRALSRLGETQLNSIRHQVLNINPDWSPDEKTREVYALLKKEAREKPGDVDMAGLYLGFALLSGEGENAFKAWMSFYRLTETSQVHHSLLADAKGFQEHLGQYDRQTKDLSLVKSIIHGLSDSGFKDYAVMLKNLHFGKGLTEDDGIDDLIKYHDFLERIEGVTMDFYYQTLESQQVKKDYQKAMRAEARKLWKSLYWEEKPALFTSDRFEAEIEKRFKAIMTYINANWLLRSAHGAHRFG